MRCQKSPKSHLQSSLLTQPFCQERLPTWCAVNINEDGAPNMMTWQQQQHGGREGMWLCAYEAWGPGLIKGLSLILREREREGWLKWRVPGWREPARDKASAKPRPLEQLFLHAAFGLVQWKEAYVWPGATLPPWLTAEDAVRGTRRRAEKEKEGGWLKLENKNALTEWGTLTQI